MSLFMFQVSVKGWGKRLAGEIHVCFGQMQEVFSCLLEVHLHLYSHQQQWMSLTNVQDLSVQPAHRVLGLALKVQPSCNKLTRDPLAALRGGEMQHIPLKLPLESQLSQMWFLLERVFCVAGATSLPVFVRGRYCTGRLELNSAAFSHALIRGPGWDPSCALAWIF